MQVTRTKKFPTGWVATDMEDGRKVLECKIWRKGNPTSRPQLEISISTAPGSKGLELATNAKGAVVIHAVKKDSPFAKHVKPGDKLTKVNGIDFAYNPIGAS